MNTITSKLVSIALAAAAFHVASGTPARAQCDDWIFTPGHHSPFRAIGAHALTLYTPPGETTSRVIVGGQDVYLNGFDIHGIAQWNGTTWQPLGEGVNFTVLDALVWNSPSGQVLVAGGNFSTAGGNPANYLAAWNGSTWTQIGGGVHQPSGGWVSAMTVWDPDGSGPQVPNLVIAGNFNRAGTVDCQNIARWDGTTWRTFGIGLNNWVNALTTWDPDGAGPAPAQIIAAGPFTAANNLSVNRIARWDGIGWRRMGDGLQNDPEFTAFADALTTWDPDGPGPLNSEVVVVGNFSSADTVEAHGIAAWNGTSWRGFATPRFTSASGVGTWDPDASGPQFPQLIVSGSLRDSNGDPLNTPAMWNGSTFQTIGTFSARRFASRFATWDPDNAGPAAPRLVCTGLISGNLPTGAGSGAIQLVNTEWSPFGSAPTILASATFGNRLLVGGQFDMIATHPTQPFGIANALNLAAWDGVDITSLGPISGTVRALRSFTTLNFGERVLVVGGTFGGAGPIMVNNVASYVEGSSDPRGGNGWRSMGQGFNGSVHALERFSSATYAGGSFTASGATTVNRVARFDGSNWQPLGTGMNSGTVHALRLFNGALYAGGTFTTAGGVNTGGLARWNGSAWSAVGGVLNGSVFSLAVHNNELIIGGQFSGVAGSTNIMKFNGTALSALASTGANASVRALAVGADGHLYAAGTFGIIGGVVASGVGRWNGTSWSDVRGGVNGTVFALQSFRNEIHAGGSFGKARDSQFVAPAWARYTIDGIPWVARQPGSTRVCVGQDAELFPAIAPGYFPLNFQWRHNGIPFTLGPKPWGSVVEFASFGLRISNAKPQDSGSYDFTATNEGCGSVTSSPGTITVCGSDFNCDGSVDPDDLGDYINCFFSNPPCADADYNSDGNIDPDDLGDFINAFFTPC
ncbi:MAG: hypothetical protein AB7K52_11845 [Phycisphaerales bacterium]